MPPLRKCRKSFGGQLSNLPTAATTGPEAAEDSPRFGTGLLRDDNTPASNDRITKWIPVNQPVLNNPFRFFESDKDSARNLARGPDITNVQTPFAGLEAECNERLALSRSNGGGRPRGNGTASVTVQKSAAPEASMEQDGPVEEEGVENTSVANNPASIGRNELIDGGGSSPAPTTPASMQTSSTSACVPCRWLRTACSQGPSPCQECVDAMAKRGKTWTCYYDPNFVQPRSWTGSKILPEEYRVRKLRVPKPRNSLGSPEEPPVSPAPAPPACHSEAVAPQREDPGPAAASKASPVGIDSVKGLVQAIKIDMQIYRDMLSKRATPDDKFGKMLKDQIGSLKSNLECKELGGYLKAEVEITGSPLPETIKTKMLALNLQDCLAKKSWRGE